MKTILIGYADREGRVLAEALDVADPADQAKLFEAAKRRHEFPKGILRLDFCRVEPVETAIFISDATAKTIATENSKQLRLQLARQEKEAEQRKAGETAAAITTEYFATAKNRNELLSKVNALRLRLSDAKTAAHTTKTKEAKATVEEYEKLLETAEAELTTAETAFTAAKTAKEKLTAPPEPKTK